jgi:MFS family permease
LFQVGSIAVLQLAAVDVTARLGGRGALVIAALLIVPQIVVAVMSPWIGRAADRFGHRPALLLAFVTVPIRGVLFALVRNPYVLVPVQVLEGAGGAAFGVMLPLVAADLTGGKNYTLCLSLLGLANGAGTAASTALAGWTADRFGRPAAYWALVAAGLVAVALVTLAMPETRPGRKKAGGPDSGTA